MSRHVVATETNSTDNGTCVVLVIFEDNTQRTRICQETRGNQAAMGVKLRRLVGPDWPFSTSQHGRSPGRPSPLKQEELLESAEPLEISLSKSSEESLRRHT